MHQVSGARGVPPTNFPSPPPLRPRMNLLRAILALVFSRRLAAALARVSAESFAGFSGSLSVGCSGVAFRAGFDSVVPGEAPSLPDDPGSDRPARGAAGLENKLGPCRGMNSGRRRSDSTPSLFFH